jgi:hypothetical protein
MAGHHTSHPRHPPTRGAVGVLCWASAQSYAGSPCGTVATGHPVPNLWGACCNMGRRPLRVPCYPPPGAVALVRMDGRTPARVPDCSGATNCAQPFAGDIFTRPARLSPVGRALQGLHVPNIAALSSLRLGWLWYVSFATSQRFGVSTFPAPVRMGWRSVWACIGSGSYWGELLWFTHPGPACSMVAPSFRWCSSFNAPGGRPRPPLGTFMGQILNNIHEPPNKIRKKFAPKASWRFN